MCVWPVWKIKLLVTTSCVVLWLSWSFRKEKKKHGGAYIFFNNITLFTRSSWQPHYILGGGMWSCGNLCYVRGLLSGKGEQWLTAPVWKALGFREKSAQKAVSNLMLSGHEERELEEKGKLFDQMQWMTPRFAWRGFLNKTHPNGWLIFALEAFNTVLHEALSVSLLSPSNSTHTARDRNTEWECKHWLS